MVEMDEVLEKFQSQPRFIGRSTKMIEKEYPIGSVFQSQPRFIGRSTSKYLMAIGIR